MATNFNEGVRDDTSLIFGIGGASGSGKTVSALLLAVGLAGDEPIAFIDTEGGRARHYFPTPNDKRSQDDLLKDFLFRVKYMDMKPPFSPKAIWLAINEAIDTVGARVIVIDSASDEWEGSGGLHDMHIAEMARLAKKPYADLADWELNKYNFPAWSVPKTIHKTHLMKELRQVRAHVIFCFRAKEVTKPVEIIDDSGRKRMTVQNVGWQAICEQNMLYDMTVSMMVTPENKGVPLVRDGKFFGKLNPPFSQFFEQGKQISVETGRKIRAWARGENAPAAATAPTPQTTRQAPASPFLFEYNTALSAEAFRADLEETHAKFRLQFSEADEAIKQKGRRILSIHTDRVENRIDANRAFEMVNDVLGVS